MPQPIPGTVTIDSRNFLPVIDKQRGTAFWRDGKVSLQEGEPGEVVTATWNRFLGMGEVARNDAESRFDAYTEHMDDSAHNFCRFSTSRYSVTPATVPGDNPTYFWEEVPTAPDFYVDFVTTTKSTGGAPVSQNVSHGLGVVPKMIIAFMDARTNETVTAGMAAAIGFSDGTNTRGTGIMSLDAQADGTSASHMSSNLLTIVDTSSNTTIVQGTVSATSTTNFTINWTTNNASAYVMHFLVIGGADVNAKVLEATLAASTGIQSFTSAGFAPTGYFVLSAAVAPSEMAYDATSTEKYTGGAPATNVTFSHTCTASPNRFLIVHIEASGTTDNVTGVTYNGVALTRRLRTAYSAGAMQSYVYTLVAPANGANNVVVSFNNDQTLIARAISASGVNQTDPYRTPSATSANSTSYSKTYTSAVGELVFSLLAGGLGALNETVTATPAAGQTELYDSQGNDDTNTPLFFLEGSTEAGATSVTMSGTVNGYATTPYTIHTMIALKPLAASTTADTLRFGIGGADSAGNQFAIANASDETATTATARRKSSALCVLGIDAAGAVDYSASHSSYDADGISLNVTDAPSVPVTIFILVFSGFQHSLASFTKGTGGAPAAQAIAINGTYTPLAYLLFSDQDTGLDAATDHARFGMGGSDGTQEEAIAWQDTDNLATSSTDTVSYTSKVFAKINNDTQTIDAVADHVSFAAGVVNISWSTNDAVATRMFVWAIAGRAAGTTRYVYMASGQFAWKMSVSGTTITIVETTDFGGGAEAGPLTKFEGQWYLPLGPTVPFRRLTTVATGTGDTWTAADAGTFALALATIQDGATARLARGYSDNLVALASTAPLTSGNWGSGFEVGDTSASITNLVDTGVAVFVAKEDNLYRFETTGASRALFHLQIGSGDSTNGTGLLPLPGTETAFYNHQSGLMLIDGLELRPGIGPDIIPTNEAIPNLTLEPYLGRHYESAASNRWIFSVYRVVESGSTRTYILAGEMVKGAGGLLWSTAIGLEESAARGCHVDSEFRLWGQSGGQIYFRKLGADGGPDGGRDSLGRGAASQTHRVILPEVPFFRANGEPVPHTLKEIVQVDALFRNIDDTCPAQIHQQRDGGPLETVGSTVTSAGLATRFLTAGENDTCYYYRPIISFTTTSDYAPTTSDPQFWSATARAILRPLTADIYHALLDLNAPMPDGTQQDPPKTLRDTLDALKGAAAVSIVDPDGNTLTGSVVDTKDVRIGWSAEMQRAEYIVEVVIQERVLS